MSAYIGESGPEELAPARAWDPRYGWTLNPRFRGTEESLASTIANLKSAGVRFRIETEDDGLCTITAEDNEKDAEPVETWSLKGNDLDKSLWQLPQIQADWEKYRLSAEDRVSDKLKIRSMVEAVLRGETEWTGTDGSTLPLDINVVLSAIESQGMDPALWRLLISSLADGVEAKPVSQWVLCRTVIVGPAQKIPGIHANVGKVFISTADLAQKEGVPTADLPFDLPEGVWCKRTPTCAQSGANKWEIQVEYWHADMADWFWERA